MPFSPSAAQVPTTFKDRLLQAAEHPSRPKDNTHSCNHTPSAYNPTTDISFTTESLATAIILGQVDTKFIACLLHSPTQPRTLVLIDQHAADERVAVEEILQELCEGFMGNTIRQTEVSGPAIVLTRLEAQRLASSTFLEIFARWGISLELEEMGEGDYIQIPIKAVPTLLASRLARKEASEMTRLVRLYLDQLEEHTTELESLISKYDNGDVDDWQRVQRWMPKEMLELANSKACRSTSFLSSKLLWIQRLG
jgi:DNA mismatch repair protein MLH3